MSIEEELYINLYEATEAVKALCEFYGVDHPSFKELTIRSEKLIKTYEALNYNNVLLFKRK